MSTTGQRLAALSGLSGGSAAVHLRALASGLTAADLLVARSGLGTGSAMQHLMAEGAFAAPAPLVLPSRAPRRRVRPEDEDDAELFLLGLL